jgi:plastocyanin
MTTNAKRIGISVLLCIAIGGAGCGDGSATRPDLGPDAILADRVLTDAPRPDVAPTDAGADAAGPRTFMVTVGPGGALQFSPSTLTISAGDTVMWMWDSSGHTVNSGTTIEGDGLFCSPNNSGCGNNPASNAGAVYSHTFTETGTFPFFCRPHFSLGMRGTITVK